MAGGSRREQLPKKRRRSGAGHMQEQVIEKLAPPARKKNWLAALGPGLITGAADDDPSGIATYSQGGAQFGYHMAWTLLFTYPLMVGIQLASARIGRVTGKGLAENFRRLFPMWLVTGLVGLLAVANIVNLGADLNAMGDAAALVIGGPEAGYAAAFGIISLGLQVFIPYERYVRVLKWLTLSLLAYIGVALVAHIDWAQALIAAVWPSITWSREYAVTVVAILGTTISPYLFFWQAEQEVEEIKRVGPDKPLRMAPLQVHEQFKRIRFDTLIGMGFSNLIAFFMIVACAATLNAQGITNIATTAQAAKALEPIAGRFATLLFALGIIGTGMLAIPVLAGSAAYAIAALLRLKRGLDLPFSKARSFYAILGVAVLIGMGISLADLDPIKALYWSAVINAVISVPIMVAVMLAACSHKVMKDLTLSLKWRVLGWAATSAMALATAVMFWSMATG
jgi:NRAMP (natural resistance-associated macrophage protein)-like metal ion transporter